MPLPDAFVRSARPGDKAATKFSDFDGMYLLITARVKRCRFDYRYLGKRKTRALDTYPEVSLSKARTRALHART